MHGDHVGKDMFWGDRAGSAQDTFDYFWMIATHTQDLNKEQICKGAETFFPVWPRNNDYGVKIKLCVIGILKKS